MDRDRPGKGGRRCRNDPARARFQHYNRPTGCLPLRFGKFSAYQLPSRTRHRPNSKTRRMASQRFARKRGALATVTGAIVSVQPVQANRCRREAPGRRRHHDSHATRLARLGFPKSAKTPGLRVGRVAGPRRAASGLMAECRETDRSRQRAAAPGRALALVRRSGAAEKPRPWVALRPSARRETGASATGRSSPPRTTGPHRQPARFGCPNAGPAPARPTRWRRRIAAAAPSPRRRPFPRRSGRRNGRAPAPPPLQPAHATRRRPATAVPDLHARLKFQALGATRESQCQTQPQPPTPRWISIQSAGSANRLTQNREASLPNPGVFRRPLFAGDQQNRANQRRRHPPPPV